MYQIITHTPPWVVGLLIGLIILGLKQVKSRQVNKPLAYLLPLGMLALSFAGVITSFGFAPLAIAAWAIGLASCAALINFWLPVKGIQFNAIQATFFIPGSWIPLVVILAIFLTKYYVGVMQALNPALLGEIGFKLSLSLLYGVLSGYFVGRALCLFSASRQPQN